MKAVKFRFLGDKSGVGTVVGAVMAIVIIMLIVSGVFLWSATVTQYMTNFDRERMSEDAVVYASWEYVSGGGLNYSVSVKNTGAIDISLVSMWLITNITGHPQQHKMVLFNPPISVPAGKLVYIPFSYIQQLNQSVGGIDPYNSTYKFRVVSSRGNLFESRLVPYYAEGTTDPVAVDPNPVESRVEVGGALDEVTVLKLTVWNRLDRDITINYIASGPMYKEITSWWDLLGEEPIEILTETDWTIPAGEVDTRTFELDTGLFFNLWSEADYIKTELISNESKVVGVIFLPTEYPTATVIYNFTNINTNSTTHVALGDNNDDYKSENPISEINWTIPRQDPWEFTNIQYDGIEDSDNVYTATTATGGNTTQHIFRFKVDVDIDALIEIKVYYEGYRSAGDYGEFRIWNFNSSSWEKIGSIYYDSSWWPGRQDTTLSETYRGINKTNYVDSNGYIYLMVYCDGLGDNTIYTDYVKVEITYVVG